jgi:hypothetical protein
MGIGAEQAAIRPVIASAIADYVSESGQSVDALVAIARPAAEEYVGGQRSAYL